MLSSFNKPYILQQWTCFENPSPAYKFSPQGDSECTKVMISSAQYAK